MDDRVKPVLDQLESDFDKAVKRLSGWLAIPSVSTDPQYQGDCRRAAEWLAAQLRELGFEAGLRETPGHPIVLGRCAGPAGYSGPHILFYGHYDVQPADPLDKWRTPPFEPTIVDGPHGKRIVARGAVDDKGQVLTFVEALRAWKEAAGEIPCRVTVLVEGEEESGSANLDSFLDGAREELVGDAHGGENRSPCDIVIVSDTGMWDIDTPAITAALRGLVYLEVSLHGPSHDLHSGMAGGSVVNPVNELARIIGRIHDENRHITIDGFYDDVVPLSAERRREWAGLGFDEREFLSDVGLTQPYGEAGYSTLERQWARPTCDVNGIIGGYTGVGAKTIIPSSASAKISFRLVPNQDPEKIASGFKRWFEAQVAPGCRVEWKDHGRGRPYLVTEDSPYLSIAAESLEAATGTRPVMIGSGGSIPVVESFKRILGLDTLLIGFGLNDDRVHSPNEKFELRCFATGARSHAALLARMAGMNTSGRRK